MEARSALLAFMSGEKLPQVMTAAGVRRRLTLDGRGRTHPLGALFGRRLRAG